MLPIWRREIILEKNQCSCKCGQTVLEFSGQPIIGVECCCTSCRTAGEKLQLLDGAPKILSEIATTPYAMYRKDRVRFVTGSENLKPYKLTPKSSTRRVVASCCNTPIFTEFKAGHWLSVFADIWPKEMAPKITMRTMASDLPPEIDLPDDLQNAKTHSFSFFAKLLGAWVGMGFRTPKIEIQKSLEIL